MKIVLAGSVKFTLTKKKKLGKEKKSWVIFGFFKNTFGFMAVAYQYRFAANKYKLLFLSF